jgi:hypothetical protein
LFKKEKKQQKIVFLWELYFLFLLLFYLLSQGNARASGHKLMHWKIEGKKQKLFVRKSKFIF